MEEPNAEVKYDMNESKTEDIKKQQNMIMNAEIYNLTDTVTNNDENLNCCSNIFALFFCMGLLYFTSITLPKDIKNAHNGYRAINIMINNFDEKKHTSCSITRCDCNDIISCDAIETTQICIMRNAPTIPCEYYYNHNLGDTYNCKNYNKCNNIANKIGRAHV